MFGSTCLCCPISRRGFGRRFCFSYRDAINMGNWQLTWPLSMGKLGASPLRTVLTKESLWSGPTCSAQKQQLVLNSTEIVRFQVSLYLVLYSFLCSQNDLGLLFLSFSLSFFFFFLRQHIVSICGLMCLPRDRLMLLGSNTWRDRCPFQGLDMKRLVLTIWMSLVS